jgi:hypothetical protein
MAYFIDTFLEHRRKQWLRSIHAVEVQVDGVWHRGEISQKEIEGDTLVIKATFPTLDSVACTITASQIIDVRGETAAYQKRLIQKNQGQGTMLKLTIPIYEVNA